MFGIAKPGSLIVAYVEAEETVKAVEAKTATQAVFLFFLFLDHIEDLDAVWKQRFVAGIQVPAPYMDSHCRHQWARGSQRKPFHAFRCLVTPPYLGVHLYAHDWSSTPCPPCGVQWHRWCPGYGHILFVALLLTWFGCYFALQQYRLALEIMMEKTYLYVNRKRKWYLLQERQGCFFCMVSFYRKWRVFFFFSLLLLLLQLLVLTWSVSNTKGEDRHLVSTWIKVNQSPFNHSGSSSGVASEAPHGQKPSRVI